MENVKYSITRALAELKLLDKRIRTEIFSVAYVGGKKISDRKINFMEVDDFNSNAKSGLQSVQDLIARRNDIKNKIVMSNATTKVNIGNIEYTVAEAIERKNSIGYDKMLLDEMKRQLTLIKSQVNRNNELMEQNLEKQLSVMLGTEKSKVDNTGVELFSSTYKNQNGWELINPLDLENKIKELEKSINDFETEVDFVLSQSNALTEIAL